MVFGADGQAGRALVHACPPGIEVLPLRRADCDLVSPCAIERAMEAFLPDVVINAAAFTDVDRAEGEQARCLAVNALAPRTLASCAQTCGARMVQLSTDYVFDGAASRPYMPGDATNPLNIYGITKLQGEVGVLGASPEALVLRTAWLYAPDGRNFVETMLRLMRQGGDIRIVDDQIGTPTCASSLAGAVWTLVEAGARGIHHYTDAGVASWYDFGMAIGEEAAALGLIELCPDVTPITSAQFATVARRPAYSVLDKSATWEVLGQRAPHWRVALRTMLREKAARG